ncbi:uncharacterized protein PF11_0213 isoform X1 [Manduca sexta]|nr:uncharacterized protein PF11_0213 isoform X1 [Manduca sexta]XP_037298435.1 uncharacterized protein PF11_0213 isoform X1 [Manduca sexta]
MNNEILVEKIVQSLLSLQVEVVQNDIVQLTGTSKGTPVKVKVKVRKKDKADIYHNVISVPKRNHTRSAKEKIRLVNSDQTIMSFDMIMDTDQTVPTKKHRNKFFEILRPGICLGNPNDEKESYEPSKNQENYEITSKSDEIMKTHLTISKNDYLDISTVVSKRHQNFLGKCKPGGCLDPPFGEDKYSYTPIKQQLQLETSTFTTKNLYLGDDVQSLKRDSLIKSTSSKDKSHHDNTLDVKLIETQPKTNSILNLYRAESVNTSLSVTYSNSIITYPPPLTPSEIRLNNEKMTQQRISADNKSRKSFNEFSSTYFISPKEIKNKIENKNYEQEILRFEDENVSFQPAFCVKSESSSEVKKDHSSSPLQLDKNIESVHREVSNIIISSTKQIKQFEDLSSTNLEIAPAVDDSISKNKAALTNFVETDSIILPNKLDSKIESIHETKPITLSTHELVSRDITSKSASITIKSIDTTIKPSVRSSLAETNLIISKTLSEQLAPQETLILNKTFTLPTFLEDNFKSLEKRSSIQIKNSKSDSKMVDKTTESVNSTVLNKEVDNFSKTLLEQLAQQENLMISKNLNLPLSLEINDKSLSKRSSIHAKISKSDSQKNYGTAKLDDVLISSKLDNEVAKEFNDDLISSKLDNEVTKDHMDDECKINLTDATKEQILTTGLDLEAGHIVEEVLNDTEKKPSIFNSSIWSKTDKLSHILNSTDDHSALGQDIVPSPAISITEQTSEIKEKKTILSTNLVDGYLFSKSKESVSSKLIETTKNFNTKDNYIIKNGSIKNLTNYLNDDKIQSNQVDLKSNGNKLNEDTSIYDNEYTFKNQIKKKTERSYNSNERSENDGLRDLENLRDKKNITSTPSLVAKSTISEVSSSNSQGKVIKYEQNQLDKYESEHTTQEKSNIKKGFQEFLKETNDQPFENANSTVMPFPQQKEDLSHIDTTSLPNALPNQNLENEGFNIKKNVFPSEEALLKKDTIPSAEITTDLKLRLSKEALYKWQEKNSINSTKELENLTHDNINEFTDSVVQNNIPNIVLDNSTKQLLDDKSNTIQVIDTKEDSLNYSPEGTTEDIKRMLPDQYDEQVKTEINSVLDKPITHRISNSNIDYINTYSTSEPIEVNDTMIEKKNKSQENGNGSIGATMTKHDSGITSEFKADEHVSMRYYELKNNKIIQNEIANTAFPERISNEVVKNNLINEAENNTAESEFNKSDLLDIEYTTMSLYPPNIKNKQKIIINKSEDEKDESNLERPKLEKLSTIFDVVAMPDTTKLKQEITTLKSRSVLYTPSEDTLTKTNSKETVAVDLAFQSYVNNENKIIIKTFNSEKEAQRYSDDRVIIIKSDISLYNNEMKIPIDSENSLFLQIKKVNNHIPHDVIKDAPNVYHTDMATNKFQTPDVMAPNLHSIYEKELLPLQNAMKDLKAEIDHLARHSSILKENLITRKSNNLRLININKRCVCLKRLF